jgi:hypothetical protein
MQPRGIYQKEEGIPSHKWAPEIHREFGPLVSSPHVSCHVIQSTNEYMREKIAYTRVWIAPPSFGIGPPTMIVQAQPVSLWIS